MTATTGLILLVVLVLFFGLLAIRLHVGLSLMASAFVGVLLLRGTGAGVSTVANQPFSTAADYSLTIIPLFIVMGIFAVRAGLARAGFDLASALLRRLPGGPALASLAGSGMFAAVTGSSVATVATMARVSTDAIVRAGYSIRLAAGVVCAGGTLGVLIPPSIVLVLYGVVTEESIGQLLIAGIGPGVVTIAAYAVAIVALVMWQRRRAARRADVDATTDPEAESGQALPEESAESGAPGRLDLLGFGYLVVIFAVSIGTIYLGLATPTEAASFGAFAALIILLPLGMFLDGISMILIAAPLLHPILTGYGFDGIWIGVLIVKVAEMALITPPVGMNAFAYSGAVREAGLGRVFRGVVPFILADIVVVALLIVFPAIVTFLPSMSAAQ
ncbi:MAG: TRAP transporter large permease subunit [Mycobacterium sp.]